MLKKLYCQKCEMNVNVKKVNHPLHIILSIVTSGVWLIPYIFMILGSKSKCPNCGGRSVE